MRLSENPWNPMQDHTHTAETERQEMKEEENGPESDRRAVL